MSLSGIRGFYMALVDSVPGVFGGTITFSLGLYGISIESPSDLMGRDNGRRKTAFLLLAKLGVGWVIGFCMLVLILSSLFEVHIYQISPLFLGLTLPAIPMTTREEKEVLKDRYGNIVFTLTGILLVSCITYFNPPGGEGISVLVKHLSLGLVMYVFFIIMIAITVMVLPSISGSTLFLIFRPYVFTIGAAKEFLHMNMDYFPILMVFGPGVVTGIVGIIKITKMCSKRYRSQTIYATIGLITGSLYVITMGPITLDVPRVPMSLSTFSTLSFLLGGVILAGLELSKVRLGWFVSF